jgi:hypothetical protein
MGRADQCSVWALGFLHASSEVCATSGNARSGSPARKALVDNEMGWPVPKSPPGPHLPSLPADGSAGRRRGDKMTTSPADGKAELARPAAGAAAERARAFATNSKPSRETVRSLDGWLEELVVCHSGIARPGRCSTCCASSIHGPAASGITGRDGRAFHVEREMWQIGNYRSGGGLGLPPRRHGVLEGLGPGPALVVEVLLVGRHELRDDRGTIVHAK